MTERREHQCHKTDCDSQATHCVDLHLECPAPGGFKRVISLHATIQVCDKHQADVPGYLFSDANKKAITVSLSDAGIPEPDWLTPRVEFIPIPPDPIVVLPEVVGCDRAGCANPAKWRIKQLFRAVAQNGKGKPSAGLMSNIYVCDKHRKDTKPADLLHGKDRDRTRSALNKAGMLLPDLDGMVLEFVPVKTGGGNE